MPSSVEFIASVEAGSRFRMARQLIPSVSRLSPDTSRLSLDTSLLSPGTSRLFLDTFRLSLTPAFSHLNRKSSQNLCSPSQRYVGCRTKGSLANLCNCKSMHEPQRKNSLRLVTYYRLYLQHSP